MRESTGLVSERLELVPVTVMAVESELAGDGRLSAILGAEVTAEWPPVDWDRPVLELLAATFARDAEQQAFQRYVLLRRADGSRVLVGCVGGFVWPERPDEIEIGYSVLPAFRRRGYAFEAAERYVAFVRERAGAMEVVAQTFPQLEASVRILERLGFVRDGVGREEGAIGFRLKS